MRKAVDHARVVDFAECLPAVIRADYFARRAAWFRHQAGVPDLATGRDEYDDLGYTVLATDGHECLGGVRVTGRRPGATA